MLSKVLRYLFAALLLYSVSVRIGTWNPLISAKKQKLCCELRKSHNLTQDDQDENPKNRKKYRSKGLQVMAPLIEQLSFKKFHHSSVVTYLSVHRTYTSFLYCVSNKRGPPSLG